MSSTKSLQKIVHNSNSSHHFNEWVNGSAISLSLTQKWLEHYSNRDAIASLLGWKSYRHTPGWAVRSVDPLTGNRTNTGQFKPNEPILFPDSPKLAKYISFPKAGNSDPLFSVMVLDEWVRISEAVGVPINNEDIEENSEDLGFWRWVIKHPNIKIVITEGGKKAASLLSNGTVAIALAGVWNGQNKKKLHPILKPFLVRGRQVYLAFDADVVVKENVEAALLLFGGLCTQQNASVYIVQWPLELGKGVDDLIVKRGVEAFTAAMEEAKSYADWRKSLEDKYRAASLGDEENDNDNDSTGKKKKKKPPSPICIAQKLFHKYRELLAWDDTAQTWMRYQSLTNGTWNPESNLATVAAIAAELEADPAIGLNYNKNYLTEVVFHLRLKVLVKEWVQADSRKWLPMLDGVLELATMKLHPHSPGFRFTWCLPYRWADRHIGCQPVQNWLLEIMGGDPLLAELLRAYLRAIVTGSTDLQKFLEIIGPGGTGKSTYLKLAQALVGNDNCVVTELKHLEQNRFELATLIHKRLVVVTDADKWGGSVNALKAITGEDHLRIEKKHIQSDGKGIKSKAMVLIAANEVIQSSDYTSGLGRRRLTLNFQYQVPEDKQHPLIEIEEDGISGDFAPYLPGLLEWVLDQSSDRMRELVKDTAVSIPHLNRIRLEKLCDTNPLADWADFCLSISKNARTYIGIAKKDKSPDSSNIYIGVSQFLYPSYCEYTTATGHKPISQRRFTGLLHDLLVCQLKLNDINRGKDRNGSYFDGIRIRPDNDFSLRIISGTEAPTIDLDVLATGSNTSSNNINCDGSNPIGDGSVMAETNTRDECDGCDGSFTPIEQNKNLFSENADDIRSAPLSEKKVGGKAIDSASIPENPSPQGVEPSHHPSHTHHEPVTNGHNAHLLPYFNCIGSRVIKTNDGRGGIVTGLSTSDGLIFLHIQLDGDNCHVPVEVKKLVFEDGQAVEVKSSTEPVSSHDPDYSTYPHPTSTDTRAAINRATNIKNALLNAGDKQQLLALKQQYNRSELVWVYRYLLDDSQRASVSKVAGTVQLSLWNSR